MCHRTRLTRSSHRGVPHPRPAEATFFFFKFQRNSQSHRAANAPSLAVATCENVRRKGAMYVFPPLSVVSSVRFERWILQHVNPRTKVTWLFHNTQRSSRASTSVSKTTQCLSNTKATFQIKGIVVGRWYARLNCSPLRLSTRSEDTTGTAPPA